MEKAPVVSVVIPAYRHASLILETLQSVFTQTFDEPVEVIVVNDGSPDNTAEVVSPLVATGRIVYVEQRNQGQAAARNCGIALARGEFIALLDDDDLMPPDKLSWQVTALRAHPTAGVVYGFPQCINDACIPIEPFDWYGNPLPWPWDAPSGWVYNHMVERCWIVSPGQTLIRRSVLSELRERDGSDKDGTQFLDTNLGGADDWDLWIRLSERHPFLFEKRCSLLYRFHGGNASQDTLKMRQISFAFYEKHLKRNRYRWNRRVRLTQWYRILRRGTPGYLLGQVYQDRARNSAGVALQKLNYVLTHRPLLILRNQVWKFYLITLWRFISQSRVRDVPTPKQDG